MSASINFSQVLIDMDGSPIEDSAKQKRDDSGQLTKGPNLTLGSVCINSLMSAGADNKDMDGDEKLHRYVLSAMIRDAMKPDGKQPSLKAEDVLLIKKCIAGMYFPIVAGQAWQMIEGE